MSDELFKRNTGENMFRLHFLLLLVQMKFRGREITHSHIGREKLEEIKTLLSDVGVVEQHPNMDGRDMIMLLAPSKEQS